VTVIDDAWARNLDATDRGHAIRVLRVRSIICVPVITPSGDVIGALTCALDDASERENYGPNDLGFVQEVGRRAGAAIANVQLYERERRIAIEFQAASLPARLPDVPGVRLDAAYRPGSDEATIGGDWYDAFLLDDGRLVMTTGDVLGHGLHAAVSMTKLRLAMQSAAIVDADPRLMLRVAEATLRVSDPDAYATAIAAVYDPEVRALTIASAGHPPPMMRTSEGTITELPTSGAMLGLGPSIDRDTITINLPAGATVVLYTDGLVEFKRDLAAGVERLMRALRNDSIGSDRPAEALLAAVLAGDCAQDDIAVIRSFGGESHDHTHDSSNSTLSRLSRIHGRGERPTG
jgi:serine phosphatase RsbU (regulator of sigma subunit)